jgi:hypothetical protein
MYIFAIALFQTEPPGGELAIPVGLATILSVASPFIVEFFRNRIASEKFRFIVAYLISGVLGGGIALWYGLDSMGLAAFVNGAFMLSQAGYHLYFKPIFRKDTN